MNTQYLKAEIMVASKAQLEEIKFAVNMREYQLNEKQKHAFQIGAEVIFGRPKGQKRQGTIITMNPKKAVIRVGASRWRVPYSLMEAA
tara:strand:+ start:264 stop:527 length:264 start_codon:yes stop_codon:yes gene_type:complete